MSFENTLSIGFTTSIGGTATLIYADKEKTDEEKKQLVKRGTTIIGATSTTATTWNALGQVSASNKIEAINQYRESAAYVESVDSNELMDALSYIDNYSNDASNEELAEKMVEAMSNVEETSEKPIVKSL